MISSRFDDESFLTDMDQQISKLKCQSSKQRLDSRLHTNNNDTGVKAFCHLNFDGPVNIHDTEMVSPPRMKIGTLCRAKGAAVMRSNFL
jgi:hypothetical protein